MLGCLVILGAVLIPRLLLFIYWITGSFAKSDAWDTWWWPLLGFFFMPATTLVFGLCRVYGGGDFGFWWIVGMVIAVVYDLGSHGSAEGKRRR